MSGDNLAWLMDWYLRQCDDDWEHSYGVEVETLDNPGWSLTVNLNDTPLEGRPFERATFGEIADDLEEWRRTGSWWVAEVKGGSFTAACGPLDLDAVIGVFRRWAEGA